MGRCPLTRRRSPSSAPDRPGSCSPTCSRGATSTASCSSSATGDYVEHRVRAGVLEHPTVELLRALGLADRLDREGLAHRGIELAFDGGRHRIDFVELTGRSITVYGQQEVVKDLIAARLAAGGEIVFEAADVTPADLDTRSARRALPARRRATARCAAGSSPGATGRTACAAGSCPDAPSSSAPTRSPGSGSSPQAAPSQDELVYASHDRGFALYSMRSPTVTRLYLQVAPDETLDAWPDDRIWDELARRLPTADGFVLNTGPILERGITGMHSSVTTPMRHGSLLLAGDAAHIVPATGAKGMNLAIADATVMADVIEEALRHGRPDRLAEYEPTCAAAGVADAALLAPHDDDAAPLRRRPVPARAATRRAGARHVVDGRRDRPRRALRRPAVRPPRRGGAHDATSTRSPRRRPTPTLRSTARRTARRRRGTRRGRRCGSPPG